jgi:hypothetical protein
MGQICLPPSKGTTHLSPLVLLIAPRYAPPYSTPSADGPPPAARKITKATYCKNGFLYGCGGNN